MIDKNVLKFLKKHLIILENKVSKLEYKKEGNLTNKPFENVLDEIRALEKITDYISDILMEQGEI